MKKLILFGFLLLAGLSFADKGVPANWMQALEGRYACLSDPYMDGGYNDFLYALAGKTCDMNTDTLYSYLRGSGSMEYDLYDMCEDSGCYGSQYTSTTAFMPSMAGFNANNAGFKATFLAMMRECISNPAVCDCSESEILIGMQNALNAYKACVASGQYCHCEPQ